MKNLPLLNQYHTPWLSPFGQQVCNVEAYIFPDSQTRPPFPIEIACWSPLRPTRNPAAQVPMAYNMLASRSHKICTKFCSAYVIHLPIYPNASKDDFTGIILFIHPANERPHYIVTSSLIGWCIHKMIPDYTTIISSKIYYIPWITGTFSP